LLIFININENVCVELRWF